MSSSCTSPRCNSATYLSGPVGQAFTSSLQFLFTAQCLINDDWPPDSSHKIRDLTFDYIVVGAGTAGSVVAARLSEDSCRRVLLVEAGDDPPFESQVPAAAFAQKGDKYFWHFKAEKNSLACRGADDRRCIMVSGKVLGGSSSINGINHVRGNRKDYDELDEKGNHGWNYNEALKYFKKSENMTDECFKNDKIMSLYHNYNGLLGVSVYKGTNDLEKVVMKAYNEVGYDFNLDYNGHSQLGVSKLQINVKDGRRASTASAFLVPAKNRENLTILKNALVTKIIIADKTAKGVNILLKNNTEIKATALKEVVLSAGGVKTPQLLMLSGIGPSAHLKKLGISRNANLSVGQNFADHLVFPLLVNIDTDIPTVSKEQNILNIVQYILTQTGEYSYLNSIGQNVIAFVSLGNGNERPTFQIYQSSYSKNSIELGIFCRSKYNENICNSFESLNANNTLVMYFLVLLNEESRGNITLRNRNVSENPIIHANYFAVEADLDRYVEGINFIERLINTTNYKSIGAKIDRMNVENCNDFTFPSKEYWKCLISLLAFSFNHFTGTAKMGPLNDTKAVVNPDLQVYGIKHLRVIDASVIPNNISGNTNAPIIMFAERGSDLIKAAHSHDECDK